MKRRFYLFLLMTALLLSLAACQWEPLPEPPQEQPPAEQVGQGEDEVKPPAPVEAQAAWLSFEDYEGLFAAISKAGVGGMWRSAAGSEPDAPTAAAAPMEEAAAEDSAADGGSYNDGKGGGNYSTTNVQVEGVDEADIVKTDGEYIYVLSQGDVRIVKADGPDTAEAGFIDVCDDDRENGYEYASEMYLDQDILAVVVSRNSWSRDRGGSDITSLRCYDVSQPQEGCPLIYETSQDGYYLSSRLLHGDLYLLSNYYIYDGVEEDRPDSFVPRLYGKNGAIITMSTDDIALLPEFDSLEYVVLSTIDLGSGRRLDQQAVLGAGSTVYMSRDNLYLAGTRYEEEEGQPYAEGVYTVREYSSMTYTHITRFSLAEGGLELAAVTELEGRLDSQFALDEYEDHLRVALTSEAYGYKIYEDEEYGFSNYVWDEEGDRVDNAVHILDLDLQLTGELTGLAEGEWIRSVRFSGPIGYVCTFETIDPLFAIDLSDPQQPQVLSALKIPGFSEYLHPWSQDLLLGLGYATNQEGTSTECVKLSMFDCSDPQDVQETDVYRIDDLYYTEALYNHKAACVSPDKNLICFPGNNGYLLFAYEQGQGFRLVAGVDFGDSRWYDWNSRGLWAGDYFYVAASCGVLALDMSDYALVGSVYFEFEEEEPGDVIIY